MLVTACDEPGYRATLTTMATSADPKTPPSAGPSRNRRALINVVVVAIAVGLLVLGAIYGADTDPDVVAASQAGGIAAGDSGDTADGAAAAAAVEGVLPRSGQGSTCTEPIGVDLIPGYAATLTINGRVIDQSEMNLYEPDPENPDATVLQAGASLNQFTWGPEPGCPNGELIRPKDNDVEACVYKLADGPSNCRVVRFRFDAL